MVEHYQNIIKLKKKSLFITYIEQHSLEFEMGKNEILLIKAPNLPEIYIFVINFQSLQKIRQNRKMSKNIH